MASNVVHTNDSKARKPPTAPKPSAALQGATMAFGKPTVKPKPTSTFVGQNAALAAASKADKDSASASRAISAQHTGTTTEDEVWDTPVHGRVGKAGAFRSGPEPGVVRSRLNDLAKGERPRSLQPPVNERSQSHIAANLAASRSASISPNRKMNSGKQGQTLYEREAHHNIRSLGLTGESHNDLRALPAETTDIASIPSTSSLIGTFEQFSPTHFAKSYTLPVDGTLDLSTSQSERTSTRSIPNPPSPQVRPTVASSAHDPQSPRPQSVLRKVVLSPPSPKARAISPTPMKCSPMPEMNLARASTGISLPSSTVKTILPDPYMGSPSPKLKSARAKTGFNPPKPNRNPMLESPVSRPLTPKSGPPEALEAKSITIPPPRKKATGKSFDNPPAKSNMTPPLNEDEKDTSSEDSFVSASDGLPPDRRPRNSNTKAISIPSRSRLLQSPAASRNSTATSQNSMSVNSLADAMVASALASSRGLSPSSSSPKSSAPAPPPSRRSTPSLFHTHLSPSSRTPSPSKSSLHKHHTGGKSGMRTTMRKAPRSSDDEDVGMVKRGRKNLMKKHPNKHHEGDRKRWRDVVSERERKRYEGLWASNKGLFTTPSTSSNNPSNTLSPYAQRNASTVSLSQGTPTNLRPPPEDCVSNLVVRDIWSRSRLPADVLSDIWELVDRSGTGMLSREEFVAGMWLVDQRLKGRKLPQRVGESVWSSLGTLGGVRVKDKHVRGAAGKGRAGNSGSGR